METRKIKGSIKAIHGKATIATTIQYNKANNTVGFGALVAWAQEDNYDMTVMILEGDKQTEENHIPEEKKVDYKIDEKSLIKLAHDHKQ